MVGERDREQDAVRWELEDTAAISIPPPFNNGILQYNQLQQQHYAAMAVASAAEDMPSHWDDEQNYGLMGGDGMVGGLGTSSAEKGVRFPATSPTHGFSNGQLSQAPLQSAHSRYRIPSVIRANEVRYGKSFRDIFIIDKDLKASRDEIKKIQIALLLHSFVY